MLERVIAQPMARKASAQSSLQKFLYTRPQKVGAKCRQKTQLREWQLSLATFCCKQVSSGISLIWCQREPVICSSVYLLITQLHSQDCPGFTRFVLNGSSQLCQLLVRGEDCITAPETPFNIQCRSLTSEGGIASQTYLPTQHVCILLVQSRSLGC